jgi:cytochrome c553
VKALLFGLAVLLVFPVQAQVSVEKNYQATCSTCHDGGTGDAPRMDSPKAWEPRLAQGRLALYQSALHGKPNTAMAAKGGFAKLSDAEVRNLVDYMLMRLGAPALPMQASNARVGPSKATVTAAEPRQQAAGLTDQTISQAVAKALQSRWREQSTALEERDGKVIVRGLGIQIQTSQGIATLSGTVQDAAQVQQAETLARTIAGVRQVTNRLIAASLFEWD